MTRAKKQVELPPSEATIREITGHLARARERRGYNRWDLLRGFVARAELALCGAGLGAELRRDAEAEAGRFEECGEHFDAALAALRAFAAVECRDILGEVYMTFTEGDSVRGQYFTPSDEARAMGRLALSVKLDRTPTFDDPFTVCDISCGSGALLLAQSLAFPREWVEDGRVLFYGADADFLCTRMARVQMALYGLRGEIRHGDALRMFGEGGLAAAA